MIEHSSKIMSADDKTDFSFEAFGDFRFRCTRGSDWVDFWFSISGPAKSLGIGKVPRQKANQTSEDLVDLARAALIQHLEGVGYSVRLLNDNGTPAE